MVESYPRVGYLSGVPGEAPPLGAGDAPARSERPSFADVAPDEPSTLGNQMAQHPPLAYLVGAVWLRLLDLVGPVAFDVEVWWLRLLSVLLVAPLPWLAARTARTLDLPVPAVAGAAVAVLSVPMLTHIGSAVNNDALLVLASSAATLHGAAFAAGDRSLRRAVWLGLAIGTALLTKLFALALLPLVAGAALVAWRRNGDARSTARSAIVAVAVATVVGGWWWLRNLSVHGTLQPSGVPAPPAPEGFSPDLGWWAPFLVARLVRRWWLEPDTVARTTPAIVVVATLLALAAIVAALVRCRGRRASLAVLTIPAVGCLAIVLVGAWRAYARTGIPFAIHGRYLYPGLVGLAVVAAAGVVAVLGRRGLLALLGGAVVLQLAAAWWTLTFYWGVPDTTAPLASFRAWLAWSPVPAPVTLAPVVLAVGGTLVAGVTVTRMARRRLPG